MRLFWTPLLALNTLEAGRELLDKKSALYSNRPLPKIIEMYVSVHKGVRSGLTACRNTGLQGGIRQGRRTGARPAPPTSRAEADVHGASAEAAPAVSGGDDPPHRRDAAQSAASPR